MGTGTVPGGAAVPAQLSPRSSLSSWEMASVRPRAFIPPSPYPNLLGVHAAGGAETPLSGGGRPARGTERALLPAPTPPGARPPRSHLHPEEAEAAAQEECALRPGDGVLLRPAPGLHQRAQPGRQLPGHGAAPQLGAALHALRVRPGAGGEPPGDPAGAPQGGEAPRQENEGTAASRPLPRAKGAHGEGGSQAAASGGFWGSSAVFCAVFFNFCCHCSCCLVTLTLPPSFLESPDKPLWGCAGGNSSLGSGCARGGSGSRSGWLCPFPNRPQLQAQGARPWALPRGRASFRFV